MLVFSKFFFRSIPQRLSLTTKRYRFWFGPSHSIPNRNHIVRISGTLFPVRNFAIDIPRTLTVSVWESHGDCTLSNRFILGALYYESGAWPLWTWGITFFETEEIGSKWIGMADIIISHMIIHIGRIFVWLDPSDAKMEILGEKKHSKNQRERAIRMEHNRGNSKPEPSNLVLIGLRSRIRYAWTHRIV